MLILLGVLIAATCLAPLLIKVLGRPAFGVLAIPNAVGFFWVLQLFTTGAFNDGQYLSEQIEWMPSAHLALNFRLDPLAGLFSLIILGIGTLVMVYCWGYFSSLRNRSGAFAAEMAGFATAMYGLVISDNLLLMYVFWEITSVLSFLLVSYYGERASSRRSAGQALMVTTLGGLAMLLGIILFGRQSGIWDFSQVDSFTNVAQTPYVTIAIILILAGALSKSAIAPAHFWLPGAMAAPTPVSAYLHSAAMVKAGIFLVAVLAPYFQVVTSWHLVVIPLGLFTMLLGGWMALKHKDLKLILAYGTVSQLGFITSVMAIGSREAMQAGLAMTFAHALFKSALFMVTGAIDHSTGTRDIDKLSGLRRKEPLLFIIAALSTASMAGVPPLFGFVSKEAVLEAVLHEDLLVGMPRAMMTVAIVVGSILTMAYSLRFMWGAFSVKNPEHVSGGGVSPAVHTMHRVSPLLWLPPGVSTALTVFFGIFPELLSAGITQHLNATFPLARGVDGAGQDASEKVAELALWHGFTVPLGLSAIIIAAGALMHWQRHLVYKAQFDYPALGSADDAYDAVLMYLRNASLRITASTQRGSLQVNLAIIFGVLILLPTIALISGQRNDIRMILADNPWQAIAALVIIAAAIGSTVLDNRLSAVIVVGITGYSLAFIFALYGAPDLALTQLLVETIIMVLFMLVLRKMPANTEWRQDPKLKRLRAWLSIGVGLSVTTVAMFAMNARSASPISEHMPELAKNIGHGDNAVNVLLVDLRAWDTLGEISVLVIAATGIASLIYRTQSFRRASRRPTLRVTGRRWLATGVESETAQNRSLMVDVATRLLFPCMMALSAYFFFAGHNAPGGGFAGGLVASLAFTLRYLAGGRAELEEALPIDASRILGAGLFISTSMAVIPLFFERPVLSTAYEKVSVPLIGDVSLPSALVFDLGVYLIVVGLTLLILNSLGGQLDREEEMRKQRARDRARNLARQKKRRDALRRSKAAATSTTTAASTSTAANTTSKGGEK